MKVIEILSAREGEEKYLILNNDQIETLLYSETYDEYGNVVGNEDEYGELEVIGTTYHDGHNFQTAIWEADWFDTETRIMDDDEAAPILKAYEKANFVEAEAGFETAIENGYEFTKSYWQNYFEVASVCIAEEN